jgi:hypothetical protein
MHAKTSFSDDQQVRVITHAFGSDAMHEHALWHLWS